VSVTQATRSLNQVTWSTWYASLTSSSQPLELAFFANDGLALNKIAPRVTGGDDYNLSQRWSGAIHRYHPLVDGIFPCIGIFHVSRHYNGMY
jgi:hypothetical protein